MAESALFIHKRQTILDVT